MPNFVLKLDAEVEVLAERLVRETLIPLFRQLHPEKQGWNLSLVNLAAANLVEGASEKGGVGRDIGKMFKLQNNTLSPFRVRDEPAEEIAHNISEDVDVVMEYAESPTWEETMPYKPKFQLDRFGSEDFPTPSQELSSDVDDVWEEEDDLPDTDTYRCDRCSAVMPLFAMGAHERFHAQW